MKVADKIESSGNMNSSMIADKKKTTLAMLSLLIPLGTLIAGKAAFYDKLPQTGRQDDSAQLRCGMMKIVPTKVAEKEQVTLYMSKMQSLLQAENPPIEAIRNASHALLASLFSEEGEIVVGSEKKKEMDPSEILLTVMEDTCEFAVQTLNEVNVPNTQEEISYKVSRKLISEKHLPSGDGITESKVKTMAQNFCQLRLKGMIESSESSEFPKSSNSEAMAMKATTDCMGILTSKCQVLSVQLPEASQVSEIQQILYYEYNLALIQLLLGGTTIDLISCPLNMHFFAEFQSAAVDFVQNTDRQMLDECAAMFRFYDPDTVETMQRVILARHLFVMLKQTLQKDVKSPSMLIDEYNTKISKIQQDIDLCQESSKNIYKYLDQYATDAIILESIKDFADVYFFPQRQILAYESVGAF